MKLSLDHMQQLDMRPGVEVEVCYGENDLKRLWYKAILESTPESTRGLRKISVRLLKDDFATPLDQLSKNVFVRPVPPQHLQAQVDIKEGCVVDAIHKDEWWTGLVIKEIKDDKFLVFFNSPTNVFRMEKRLLRPHLDWVYKRWWVESQSELQKQYMISLEATKKHLKFDYSTLTEWEDGVWKVKQSPLAQGSGSKMASSVMNGDTPSKQSVSMVTTTLLKQTEEKTKGNATLKIKILPPFNNQKNDYEKDSTGDKKNSNDNNRKRKREENLSSVAIGKTKEVDTTLPFEKKLPIWKTFESMEVFKTFPQNPHFSPLVEIGENSREMVAVRMMLSFSRLLEDVKDLTLTSFNPVSTFKSLNASFAELEKHGFNVKVPQSRIHKLLSLKDKQTKKMEELIGVEKENAEKESERIKIENIILELQRRKEETEKQIGEMKLRAATIQQEVGDVEIQFQTTASAPW